MKKLAVLLFVASLSLSGSQVFAIEPGTYNFGGTISIDSVFATGGTGQHAADGHGYFCINGLEVGDPDVNGVQEINSTIGPPTYGVYISGIRLAVVDCVQLDPIGPITGFIDNVGYQENATVRTEGWNCEFIIEFPCKWETTEPAESPMGPAGTVVMTIPLHSSVLQEQSPGDPSATSLRAIGAMHNAADHGEPERYTLDFRDGVPLVGSSLNIVSPDVHFREWGGLLIEDVVSWTRFDGTFSQDSCPAQVPSWTDCSTVGPASETSQAFNYLLILLLPALFIAVGVIGRRK